MVDFSSDPSTYSKPVACCVCGYDQPIADFVIKWHNMLLNTPVEFYLRRCPICKTYMNNPQWQPNILSTFYDTFEYQERNHVDDKYALDIIKANYMNYENYLDEAEEQTEIKRYLDVGCGMAMMVLEASSRAWEAWGIDISKVPILYARKKFGLKNLIIGTFDRKPEWSEYFDLISMNDYIEHTNDPNEQLDIARFCLRPGGLLQILIPNVESPMMKFFPQNILAPPQHLWLWGRVGIGSLLQRHGFEVLWAKTGNSYVGQLWVEAKKV